MILSLFWGICIYYIHLLLTYIFRLFRLSDLWVHRPNISYCHFFLCRGSEIPVDTVRKLNVHKTLNVLCTFNLRAVSTEILPSRMKLTKFNTLYIISLTQISMPECRVLRVLSYNKMRWFLAMGKKLQIWRYLHVEFTISSRWFNADKMMLFRCWNTVFFLTLA